LNASVERQGQTLPAEAVEPVLAAVARLRGVDFRDYRRETIVRGIVARLQSRPELGGQSGEPVDLCQAYTRVLESDEDELNRLLETLVIPCSSFFRNPAVFAALESEVLPRLAREHLERHPLRIWCVGVATGEEAWSLAMLLTSLCERPAGLEWQLLASDIDRRALRVAEHGRYPLASAAAVPDRFRRFLVQEGEQVEVASALRDRVRFAQHDLLGVQLAPVDAVVASFDLVLCRNLLIYFDRRLQEKALERVAATLDADAVLVLGQVETLPERLQPRLAPYPGLDPDLRIFSATRRS
jgi:chemotaxis methyl-accepting protein methylase